jgi:RNase P subunit RPR2
MKKEIKKKPKGKKEKSNQVIKEKDNLCRINFLFQLAHSMYLIDGDLSRNYISELRNIAKRNVIRL